MGRTLRVISRVAVVGVLGAAALWAFGVVPASLMRTGPLEGPSRTALRLPLLARDTGALWGRLVLRNPTEHDIHLRDVSFASNPQQLVPVVEPYVWDESRADVIRAAEISWQLPIPHSWNVAELHPAQGYTIRPQDGDDSVEVVFELPKPEAAATIDGVTVRYRSLGITYQRTFDLAVVICPPADWKPCQ
ncbi:hypothetical protein FB565_008787 [Actinoplanes lutulentus]|uniref:Uncharacterized protein n=1 Tax=Actinoplanes lutulentus TaxID=1287878 RepID=A0A327YXB1_9ACTN|nr:hypothetical protein [Actinoplanes lutulentus]MBB2949001.1 hypothetical protein [Actinoplanes lutulentus]RAK26220.1 hypothetical protein B0I29_12852 [Actinoplanes lutulentus]